MEPLTGRKLDMLQHLAEHRLLTVSQIEELFSTSNAMVRRMAAGLQMRPRCVQFTWTGPLAGPA